MEELEISAGTVQEAIEEAERQLGASRDQFEVVVVRKGKTGILGIGGKEAVIKVKPVASLEQDVVKVATEVVDTLVRLMGVVGRVEASSEIPVTLNIEGDDLGILIGRRGQTLASLQYIVRLIVAGRLKAWLPLAVDVAGYKKQHFENLRKLALNLADEAKMRRRVITLEPMFADERRIIHLTLANHPDVTTHSIGEGESRKVVILLKRG